MELLKSILKGYLISPPLKLKKKKYFIIKGPFVIVYLLEGWGDPIHFLYCFSL